MPSRLVRTILATLVALGLTTLLFACGGGGGSTTSTPTSGSGATLSGTAQ